MLTEKRHRIKWEFSDYALVVDDNGNVIHNAYQQDDPVIKEKYSDGVIIIRSSKTGRLLLPPYRIDPVNGESTPVPDWEVP